MSERDELLRQLCHAALQEVTLPPQWRRLILVGVRGQGFASMSGFCFDAAGQAHPVAPRGQSVRAMKRLAQAMAEADAAAAGAAEPSRLWLSCLLRIGSDGPFDADFEYADAQRWQITPANIEQRIAEFSAMPPPGG
ncbi:hypothetical protein AAHN93_02205 [Vandammella animalimorsus]|uniref:hypothetical protein n=1 Tax=Vandammella animalimorsus TaxID=2029117 RepID=UPI0031BB066E